MRTLSRAVCAVIVVAVVGLALPAWAAFHLEYEGTKPTKGIRMLRVTYEPPPPKPIARPVARTEPAPSRQGDFWHELQQCETPNGDTNPKYIGDFQFHPDTARRAGGTDLAAAKRWAAMVVEDGGHPGSTAGWPTCWWVAKRNAGYAPY